MKYLLIISLYIACTGKLLAQDSYSCMTDFLSRIKENQAGNVQQGVSYTAHKWLNGQTIRVKFMGGSEYVRGKVKTYAQEWEKYANIRFDFVPSGEADIRISFNKTGSWSHIGKNSTLIPQDQATMNYGWFDENTPEKEFQRVTLHEFGHALGLLHEHQHADRPFEWNIPVVMNYFMNLKGWSKEKVYDNYIMKYGRGSEYSNNHYDKYSIMHYSIPPEHTIGNYEVRTNFALSQGDKDLIGEMYPRSQVSSSSAAFDFDEIEVDHNVVQNNENGMLIKIDFHTNNVKGQEHRMSAYFYDSDGKVLQDKNNSFTTSKGQVATGKNFTPGYDASKYTDFEIFMPYSELHRDCGEFRLKFLLTIWNDHEEIAESGYEYFTYWKCATIPQLDVDVKHNVMVDGVKGMKIYPMFHIKHAQGKDLKVAAYFYNQNEETLKDQNGEFTTPSGTVSTSRLIRPCCESTNYSLGDYYHFNLFLPYSELHLGSGFHDLKFFISIWQDEDEIVESDWVGFTYQR